MNCGGKNDVSIDVLTMLVIDSKRQSMQDLRYVGKDVGMGSSAHELLMPDVIIFLPSSSVTGERVLREGIILSLVGICMLH